MASLRHGLGLVARTHPFETRVLLLASAIGLAAAVAVILRLAAFGIPAACFGAGGGLAVCGGVERNMEDYYRFVIWAQLALVALLVIPVVSSALVGLALAAKELDRGTTAFVWSLTTSRRRWFLGRVGPAAIVLLVVSLAAGLLADALLGVANPTVDPARTFELMGLRGLALPGIALAVFGLTLASGAVVGRLLPAVILALVLGFAAYVAVAAVSDHFLHAETVVANQDESGMGWGSGSGRYVDSVVRTPEGDLISNQDAYDRYGERLRTYGGPLDPGMEFPPDAIVLQQVELMNPVEIYPFAEARFAVLFLAIGLGAIVVGFAVIDRRRP
jgi:ABC-type transport system involved in multi-copper enzyme maturation permease subunit